MVQWKVKVEYDGSVSVIPIKARCARTGIALMAKEIEKRHVGDRRFALGKVTLLRDDDPIYIIPQEGQGGAYFVANVKEEVVNEQQ